MHYIGNNHVGFDNAALGFPSILACQAIVYQTTQGLYGFHDMKGDTSAPALLAKCTAFAQFVQLHNITHAASAQQIYGVINQHHQYGTDGPGVTEWHNMLIGVATALGFHGRIYGARVTSHVDKSDSLYVRFDAVGHTSTARYKRWKKMAFDKSAPVVVGAEQQELGKTSPYLAPPVYGAKAPYANIYEVRRAGKAPDTVLADEGNLNPIKFVTIR